MVTRRKFVKDSALSSTFLLSGINLNDKNFQNNKTIKPKPIVISTWEHGMAANVAAWKILINNGKVIDAVEKGVMVSESDPEVRSVGFGGLPDRDGKVTLDACIMDENGNCGSVTFLQNIKNPIAVARLIMEKTPHIMLSGNGALKFALKNGFIKENLLTEQSRQDWEEWKKNNKYEPEIIDENNHDTIGMLAIDNFGNIAGACTTSGLAWKYHGRVGDSPIIGAGLFVDNEIGAACATGKGESVIKIAGSMLIVELMRNGKTPQEACQEAIGRIIKKQKDYKDFQVGFIAINRNNEIGAFSLKKGFQYALYVDGENKLIDSEYYL